MLGLNVFFAGVSGVFLVGLAAYGAHGSGDALARPAYFEVAWQIHAVHTAALLALGMCRRPNLWLHAGYWLLMGGAICFSGSLYGRSFGWWDESSIVTPVGGLMLVAGWFALAISGLYRLGYSSPSHKAED